jgi:hypothetical protein
MSAGKCANDRLSETAKLEEAMVAPQKIIVFQQNGSGESKVKGIRKYGKKLFTLELVSIDLPLPPILDDTEQYLPPDIRADLVLDFFKHPDLSHDLALACQQKKIPLIASGKKLRVKWALTPPT